MPAKVSTVERTVQILIEEVGENVTQRILNRITIETRDNQSFTTTIKRLHKALAKEVRK
jgi:hypothetical protein